MNRLTRATPLAALAALTLTACFPTPGWDGTGTIVELESLDYDVTRGGVTHQALEVTVVADGRRTEDAVEVDPGCAGELSVGDRVTVQDVTDQCGPLHTSTDD